jgi:hypothetical protein
MTLPFRFPGLPFCSSHRPPLSLPGLAQGYPEKNITFFVPFAAGSATDQLARALGQSLTAQAKQTVVVDNRPEPPASSPPGRCPGTR